MGWKSLAALMILAIASGPEAAAEGDCTAALRQSLERLRSAVYRVSGPAGKLLFYPTVAPFRALNAAGRSVQRGGPKGLYKFPFEYLKEDGAYIAGFAILMETGAHPLVLIARKTMAIDTDDYNERTKSGSGGVTVYLDATPRSDAMSGYGEWDFQNRLSGNPKAVYARAEGLEDMKRKLQELAAKLGPIDRVEILGHGFPGMVSVNGSPLAELNMDRVALRGVFAKDARINLISCFAGYNFRFFKAGERFMKGLGKAWLDQGGSVTASTLTIIDPDRRFSKKGSWTSRYLDLASIPFEFLGMAVLAAIGDNDGAIRTVTVPPGR